MGLEAFHRPPSIIAGLLLTKKAVGIVGDSVKQLAPVLLIVTLVGNLEEPSFAFRTGSEACGCRVTERQLDFLENSLGHAEYLVLPHQRP